MFLTGATNAVWVSVLAKYLQTLGFTPLEFSLVVQTGAVASIIMPLLGGQIADRWLPSERFLAISNLGAAALLFLGASQVRFWGLGSALLGASLFYANVFPLVTAMALRHLSEPGRQFAGVRVWGTIGWVLGAWGLTGWLVGTGRGLGDCLWLAGIVAAANGIYSFTLPHTPPVLLQAGPSATGKVFAMLKEPSFALFMAIFFIQQLFGVFYGTTVAVFLPSPTVGVSEAHLSAVISIGQIAEIPMLWGLPWVYRRFGEKGTMALGMAAWGLRFGVFALGGPPGLVIASIALHGPAFAFVRISATMYVDRISERDVRSSAQSLLAVLVDGVGGFLGAFLVSGVFRAAAGDWRTFWLVPAIGCVTILGIFLAAFRPRPAGALRG
jgi:MFS family permease